MKPTHLLTTVLFTMATLHATAQSVTLQALRDTTRPILIFCPSPADPRLQEQVRLLANDIPGLLQRQVQILLITDHPITLSAADPSVWRAPLADSTTALRRRFHVAPTDFAILLLGKDGGEKLRTPHPISYARLRDTIDAMPMRRQEMAAGPNN